MSDSVNAAQPGSATKEGRRPRGADMSTALKSQVTFGLIASGWLALMGFGLLLFSPGAVVWALTSDGGSLPPSYSHAGRAIGALSTMLGLICEALALVMLFQTGVIPLALDASGEETTDRVMLLYRKPAIVITSSLFGLLSLTAYGRSLTLLAMINGALGAYGVWTLMFGSEGHENRAGKDVRVSSFPFKTFAAEEKHATSQKKWH